MKVVARDSNNKDVDHSLCGGHRHPVGRLEGQGHRLRAVVTAMRSAHSRRRQPPNPAKRTGSGPDRSTTPSGDPPGRKVIHTQDMAALLKRPMKSWSMYPMPPDDLTRCRPPQPGSPVPNRLSGAIGFPAQGIGATTHAHGRVFRQRLATGTNGQ